jgi:signal transduction histidine kinase
MGNFLAAQRVDLELVRNTGSRGALDRLERGASFLERDFRHIIRVIRDYRFEDAEREELDLAAIARKSLEQLHSELKGKARLRLQPAPLRGCRQELETVVFLLMENAARYSESQVILRSGRVNRISYLFMQNDVSGTATKGTGVGLSIAERLGRRNGLVMRNRDRSGRFSLLLTWRGGD